MREASGGRLRNGQSLSQMSADSTFQRHRAMSRRAFLATGTAVAIGATMGAVHSSPSRSALMKKPKVIFFDVNETLLDLAPLKKSVGAALGGREDLLPLWFTTMLHYSLVDTMTGNYRNFDQIGIAALMMIGEKQGIDIDRKTAEEAIIEPFLHLPPHEDVKPALAKLADSDIEIVSLTNSASKAVTTQFAFADITNYFDWRISTEEVQAFKPDPRPYAHALKTAGVAPADALMVAAHAWDLMGAKNAGMQTTFIKRPGATLYPNAERPDHVVGSLTEIVEALGL
jgi:2-haloacid dehalogenase